METVNSMDFGEFVEVFGNVVERCPLVAAAVWSQRPFSDPADLERQFFAFIDALPQSGTAWRADPGAIVCLRKNASGPLGLAAQTLFTSLLGEEGSVSTLEVLSPGKGSGPRLPVEKACWPCPL